METNVTLISPKPVLGLSISPNPRTLFTKHTFNLPLLPRKPAKSVQSSKPRSRTVLFAFSNPNSGRKLTHNDDCNGRKRINGVSVFASTSSSGQETTSVGVNPQLYTSPPPSQIGSPLFWIGVDVGLSALFSFVASRVKKYAMQQAFQAMMGQMSSQNSQFSNTTFSPGSPYGFPPPSTPGPINSSGFPFQPPSTSTGSASTSGPVQAMSPSNAASQATVDVSATKSEAPEPVDVKVEAELKTEVRKTEARKSAFVDVSPDETLEKSPFEDVVDSSSENGAASKGAIPTQEGTASDWSQSAPGKPGSALSVEALEKMMEDPMVQKMIYPHLPEEMRNPATFKWMLQNPEYRQQLQDMLEKMGGSGEWDNRMMDTLKNFDFNSPDVQQQFDQLGLTPEEVISKIMANPDVAMAFQNPRVQQAIMDCSQNPMNIAKYQDDKEVMDVFNKISQLFPGTGGF